MKQNRKNNKKNTCETGQIMLSYRLVICKNSLLPAQTGGQRPKGGKSSMNKYELALVVNAKIEDDVRTATVERAKEYITRAGGTVTEVEQWGKKKLAYDIQKMSDGFYYFIQFEAESSVPAEVEQNVRIMDNVLRFLCVRKDEA